MDRRRQLFHCTVGDVSWRGSKVLVGEVIGEFVILMAAAGLPGEVEVTLESVGDDEESPDEVTHVDTSGSAGLVDVDKGNVVSSGED